MKTTEFLEKELEEKDKLIKQLLNETVNLQKEVEKLKKLIESEVNQ